MLDKRKGAKNFRFNTALRRKDFIYYKIVDCCHCEEYNDEAISSFPLFRKSLIFSRLKNNMKVKSFAFLRLFNNILLFLTSLIALKPPNLIGF